MPRLIVFPHAGGSAHAAAGLADAVGAHLETWVVEMPGRGSRWREPALAEWPEATAATAATIDDGRLSIFYGHSFGGRLAFEVLLSLQQAGRDVGRALAVTGCRAPDHPQPHPWMSALTDEAFVEAVSALGGLDDALLWDPRLLRMFLPMMRAEVGLAESWARVPADGQLDVPIAAFISAGDHLADQAAVRGWQQFSRVRCDHPVLGCSHFLDAAAQAAVAAWLLSVASEVFGVRA